MGLRVLRVRGEVGGGVGRVGKKVKLYIQNLRTQNGSHANWHTGFGKYGRLKERVCAQARAMSHWSAYCKDAMSLDPEIGHP